MPLCVLGHIKDDHFRRNGFLWKILWIRHFRNTDLVLDMYWNIRWPIKKRGNKVRSDPDPFRFQLWTPLWQIETCVSILLKCLQIPDTTLKYNRHQKQENWNRLITYRTQKILVGMYLNANIPTMICFVKFFQRFFSWIFQPEGKWDLDNKKKNQELI